MQTKLKSNDISRDATDVKIYNFIIKLKMDCKSTKHNITLNEAWKVRCFF